MSSLLFGSFLGFYYCAQCEILSYFIQRQPGRDCEDHCESFIATNRLQYTPYSYGYTKLESPVLLRTLKLSNLGPQKKLFQLSTNRKIVPTIWKDCFNQQEDWPNHLERLFQPIGRLAQPIGKFDTTNRKQQHLCGYNLI